MDTWICGTSAQHIPYPLSQEGQHSYPDACPSASPRTTSCRSEPAPPTGSPGGHERGRTCLRLLGRTSAFAWARQRPGNAARSWACRLARRRAQPSFIVLHPGLGVLSHGRSAVPYLAWGAESRPVPLSPPGSAGNHRHAAEHRAPGCREVVSAHGRHRLLLSRPGELGCCQPGSGTKQVGDRAPVNDIPHGHQPGQQHSALRQNLGACAESMRFPEILYRGGTERIRDTAAVKRH